MTTEKHDFSKPRDLSDVDVAFGAAGECLRLMPAMEDIPAEFKRWHGTPYNELQAKWFYEGLDAGVLVAKPGIDRNTALRHLQTIQGSWEPKHEHKEAGVAYLMSLWFDIAK